MFFGARSARVREAMTVHMLDTRRDASQNMSHSFKLISLFPQGGIQIGVETRIHYELFCAAASTINAPR